MREWRIPGVFIDFVKSPGNRKKYTALERLLLVAEVPETLSLQPFP
jgi:hypothetical protein